MAQLLGLNLETTTEPLNNLKAEFKIRENERNGWNIMQVDTGGVDDENAKINFSGWGTIDGQTTGWSKSGSREGWAYPATVNYYQYRNDYVTPGTSFKGNVSKIRDYSPAVTAIKGHYQPLQNATNATSNSNAIARTHNAKNNFTPTKGSYGNNASANEGDNLLIDAGTRGEGGDPGISDSEINNLTGEAIFYELISI